MDSFLCNWTLIDMFWSEKVLYILPRMKNISWKGLIKEKEKLLLMKSQSLVQTITKQDEFRHLLQSVWGEMPLGSNIQDPPHTYSLLH